MDPRCPAGLAARPVVALVLGPSRCASATTCRCHHRLGHQPLLPVREPGVLGGHTGITGIPALSSALELANERAFYFLIWASRWRRCGRPTTCSIRAPGRAIRALKGGRDMAESFGVDTAQAQDRGVRLRGAARVLSGWLYAHLQRFVNPTPFGINQGIEYLFMAVVGGAGSVWGAVLGAALITVVKQVLQDVLPACWAGRQLRDRRVRRADGGAAPVRTRRAWPWLARASAAPARRRSPAPPPPAPRAPAPVCCSSPPPRQEVRRTGGGQRREPRGGRGRNPRLIGPNGAGKSTIFNLISAAWNPRRATIAFRGEAIGRGRRARSRALGLARTFQHVRLLPEMSVLDNVALGAHRRGSAGVLRACGSTGPRRPRTGAAPPAARTGRPARRTCRARRSLPLGKQRLVEIARALAPIRRCCCSTSPRPACAIQEKQELAGLLRQLRGEGMTILLVEHDMDFVMGLADRVIVMDFGAKLAEGCRPRSRGPGRGRSVPGSV